MKSLTILRNQLNETLMLRQEHFGNLEAIEKTLAGVKSVFDNPSERLPERSVEKTLITYRQTEQLSTFLDMKYACFGIIQNVQDWSLIEDDKLYQKLIDNVEKLRPKPLRFRKCYQGLLSGYFRYPRLDKNDEDNSLINWRSLRKFLYEKLSVAKEAKPLYSWVRKLEEHKNLLTVQPCLCYGSALLKGDSSEFESACTALGVSQDSWVREMAIRGMFRAATNLNDEEFKGYLDQLLTIINGQTNFRLSPRQVISCTAHVLKRYAKCSSREEHPGLRDTAVTKIGNPWLRRTEWDAHVKDEKARIMVNSWLKEKLITDFFSILSEDGATDPRRLEYWLRFKDEIWDMWFALGPHARSNSNSDFKELRSRAQGRSLWLESGGNLENNTFIMRMGKYILVEFGITGNACFTFREDQLPFDLDKVKYVYGNDQHLKSPNHLKRLRHNDSPAQKISWEEKFDEWLLPLLHHPQLSPPHSLRKHNTVIRRTTTSTAVNRSQVWKSKFSDIVNFYNLKVKDNRLSGGALWIECDDSKPVVRKILSELGFKYKVGRGWWFQG